MKKTFLLITIYCLLSVAAPVLAQQTEYQLLAPIPLQGPGSGGDVPGQKTTASKYIEGIFMLTIAIATGLAVLAIIFGGIKYMSTDAFAGKSEAKTTIEHALWGLLLAISAWLILNTISPNLTNFNLNIPKQPPITAPPPIAPPVTGSCTGCNTIVSSLNVKPGACGKTTPPGPCQVNGELNARLIALDAKLDPESELIITEAWPPTVKHACACHAAGTCIDASRIVDTQVYGFVTSAQTSGLKAVYEVESVERKNAVISASCSGAKTDEKACRVTLNDRGGIAVLPGKIKGEHFSVYLNSCNQ